MDRIEALEVLRDIRGGGTPELDERYVQRAGEVLDQYADYVVKMALDQAKSRIDDVLDNLPDWDGSN